jgi:hypothetical protein
LNGPVSVEDIFCRVLRSPILVVAATAKNGALATLPQSAGPWCNVIGDGAFVKMQFPDFWSAS